MDLKVLQLVNSAREAMGLPPLQSLPKGRRWNSNECPLAQALNAVVHATWAEFTSHAHAKSVARVWGTGIQIGRIGNKFEVILPQELIQFIKAFDKGAFPELVVELEDDDLD